MSTPKSQSRARVAGQKEPLHRLLSLHHSADNHESSQFDVTLVYPSGLSEKFSFGKRHYTCNNKYSRPFDPLKDLLRTIQVILDHVFRPNDIQDRVVEQLSIGWETRSQWPINKIAAFKDTIQHVNNLITIRPPLHSPLSPDLMEHFIDQLHDRCVADSASLLVYDFASQENVYGELRPKFLSKLFKDTKLRASSMFLDLGSGVGQTVFQAALETKCTAYGIERERRVYALSTVHYLQFRERARLWGLGYGDVVLRQGDFLISEFVKEVLGSVDVVLVNNLKLDPRTNWNLLGLLRGLKEGAVVISTEPLGREGGSRGKKEWGVEGFRVQELEYESESVSWTDESGVYYISTRL